MPVKNEALYLDELLTSIVNQSESEWELVAVDDHSTDDSLKILNDLASTNFKIKVFQNPNQGIISALRCAYSKSSGEYITRQDADDIMPTDKLKKLLSVLNSNDKGTIATGKVKYFSGTKLMDGFKKYEKWLNDLCETNSHYDHIFKECVLASANWLIKRDDFEKLGAFSDAIYPEDYHFVFKAYQNNFKIKSSNEITHLWRDHEKRASRNLEQYSDQKFFPLKVSFFKEIHGSSDICLWGAGPTGKKLAKELLRQNINFHWVTNNEKKIGKEIYGIRIFDYQSLRDRNNHKLIISVSQRDALSSIINYLKEINLNNYYEF